MRYYLLVNNLDNNVDKSLPNIMLYLIFNIVSCVISIVWIIFRFNTNESHAHIAYKNKNVKI